MGLQQSLQRLFLALPSSCRRRTGALEQGQERATSSRCQFRLNELGDELLLNVASSLPAQALGQLGACSASLAQVASEETAWPGALRAAGGPSFAKSPRSALRAIATLQSTKWKNLAGEGPPQRRLHVAFACSGGMVIFGGAVARSRQSALGDCWALDMKSGRWVEAGRASPRRPQPRVFTADGGGGGVLLDSVGNEWLVIYGGLRGEGFRDNETWALGPLNFGVTGAGAWRWHEIQAGGGAQAPQRPTPRFHHTQTVLGGSTLAVAGGHNFMVRPILATGLLHLEYTEHGQDDQQVFADVRWHCLPDTSSSPKHRAYHSAVEWKGKLIILGGKGVTDLRDAWVLNPRTSQWNRISHDFPRCISHASLAVVENRFLVVYGGRQVTYQVENLLNDVWMLDLLAPDVCGWTCLVESCRPDLETARPPCFSALTTVIHAGRTLLVFGGHDGTDTDQFDDPNSGFADNQHTLAIRFGRHGRIACTRLCSEGCHDASGVHASFVAFPDLGLAVACRAGKNRRMQSSVLVFDDLMLPEGFSEAHEHSSVADTIQDTFEHSPHLSLSSQYDEDEESEDEEQDDEEEEIESDAIGDT